VKPENLVKNFRRGIRAAIAACLCSAALAVAGPSLAAGELPDSPEQIDPLLIGSSVPDVTLRDTGGEPISLSEARGDKPAVVVFYRGGW
jgi:hypothetical protein